MPGARSVGQVNAALAARKIKAELVHTASGLGYFYFTGPDTEDMECTSVMVSSVGALTVDQWVGEFKQLKGLPNAV